MQTSKIKKFATEARLKLKQGVAMKIQTMGFDARSNVSDDLRPVAVQGGCLWRGNAMSEGFLRQWTSLYDRIQRKGLQEVYEEAAYTWFNRLVAIRIMQKNELCEGVFDYVDTARTPRIVDDARMGRMPQMPEATRQQLIALLDDDTRTTEQFALLIAAWCHENPIINACFGGIADYTALLLPQNILAEGGFVDMLNHTDYLSDDDYRSPELIGWLYQFYISERKDEVFAKKQKYTADEIPAATQIFTPNWIVKYMVQNSINPLLTDDIDLEQIKVADLACGSGHILNECFNLLFDLYTSEGYTRSEAIESIFQNNLTGVDIDNRARQLATFALLLKASQRDESFADAHCLPRVLSMPKPYDAERDGAFMETMHEFFLGQETQTVTNELLAAYFLMGEADSLGSIMKFSLSGSTRLLIKQTVDYWKSQPIVSDLAKAQLPYMQIILALTDKYDALVMNPPYMGSGNMNAVLSDYVKKNYADSKADLFAVFMDVCEQRLKQGGRYAMINMQSWMFLSSFEALRRHVLSDLTIESMLHLGPRTFDELSGEVVQNTAFVIRKQEPTPETCGTYYRLVDGKDCADKNRLYLSATSDGNKIYYPNVPQKNFEKIPGCPIGYWVSKKMIEAFDNPTLGSVLTTREGMATADNDRFLRLWHEIDIRRFSKSNPESDKWYPYNKGGSYRKWYGNREYVVDWENNGYAIKHNIDEKTGRVRSHNYNGEFAFKESVTWNAISSGNICLRYTEEGFLWDSKGASGFSDNCLLYSLALVNSRVSSEYLKVLAPTLDFKVGDIIQIPYIYKCGMDSLVLENISISKEDWDAHETSWDFEGSPLLARMGDCGENGARLEDVVGAYKTHWEQRLRRLRENEEELNREFISIYGLEDELQPDVPLSEVTILQQNEIVVDGNSIVWNDDQIVKQLISYSAGVWMGRYRLDRKGLYIAHPNPTAEELAPYEYKGETVEIDDDGIFPLMPADCGFSDNAVRRMAEFVRQVFGAEKQAENLNYMEKCLGKTLEQYFIKDFWKDHKKMYQNRPIYWLFSSKKGAFQVIAYLHRMTPYTCERVRSKYLLPFIETLRQRIADLTARAADLSTQERRKLEQTMKQLEECTEYHDRLAVVAEQAIPLDLDDGVVVNYAKLGDVVAKIK